MIFFRLFRDKIGTVVNDRSLRKENHDTTVIPIKFSKLVSNIHNTLHEITLIILRSKVNVKKFYKMGTSKPPPSFSTWLRCIDI